MFIYVFIRLRNLGELIKYRNITTEKHLPAGQQQLQGHLCLCGQAVVGCYREAALNGGGGIYLAALAGFYNLTNSSFKDINYVLFLLL